MMKRYIIVAALFDFGIAAVADPKQAATDVADKISEIEALRYENAFLKLQRIQAACEAQPQFVKAMAAYNEETDVIFKAHRMDKAIDRFDPETRVITRKAAAKK